MADRQRAQHQPEDTPVVLVAGVDASYAMPLAVMLHSVLINLAPGTRIEVYVIDGGLSDVSRARVKRVVAATSGAVLLHWVEPDLSHIKRLPVGDHFSAANYFRLLIPNVVPARHKRAIYLDSDLVVDADLTRLWTAEMGDDVLLGVPDFSQKTLATGLGAVQGEGLDPEAPYFNSGVLVWDLNRWRTERLTEKVFAFLKAYVDHNRFCDQDGLNAVLAGRWGELNPRWNVQSKVGYGRIEWYRSISREAYIYHFTGGYKPWNTILIHPGAKRFLYYLKSSNWFAPLDYWKWYVRTRLKGGAKWVEWWCRKQRPKLTRRFRRKARAAVQRIKG